MKSLKFYNLLFGYQNPLLDQPINIEIRPSTLNVIFGNNGCGKTSLIKNIARLLNPLSGQILLNGQDIFKMSLYEYPRYFSFLFTMRPFLMNHTVFDIIALGRIPYLNWNGKLSANDSNIVLHYAKKLGLKNMLYEPATTMSDGQLQKTLIAKTLAQQTPVIVLDEILSFLDYGTKQIILDLLKNIAKTENKIILMTSHDVELSIKSADNILIIHKKQWKYGDSMNIRSQNIFNDFISINYLNEK